jgi:hypothetical protein
MSGWLTRGRIALVLALVAYAGSAWWMLSRRTEAVIGGRTKVTIAHWQIEYGPPEGLEAVIKRYEELNPHIDVEQVLVPGRIYRQWLRTNLVGRHRGGHPGIRLLHARHAGRADPLFRAPDGAARPAQSLQSRHAARVRAVAEHLSRRAL